MTDDESTLSDDDLAMLAAAAQLPGVLADRVEPYVRHYFDSHPDVGSASDAALEIVTAILMLFERETGEPAESLVGVAWAAFCHFTGRDPGSPAP